MPNSLENNLGVRKIEMIAFYASQAAMLAQAIVLP